MISMNNKEVKLVLSGLTCANCANKIETRVNNLEGVKEANLNFTTSTLTIEGNEGSELKDIVIKAKEIINKLEHQLKEVVSVKALVDLNNLPANTTGTYTLKEVPFRAYNADGEVVLRSIQLQVIKYSLDVSRRSVF